MVDGGALVRDLQVMRDEGHLSDALLRYAVRTTSSSDDRFSWVGVYLLNAEANELWLHNYVGTPTEHAKIPVGSGICGRAVDEMVNVNVPDVTKEEYLTCAPDVMSEMVVLIRAGDEIFGEIVLDSEDLKAFTEDDDIILQGVADKLAEQLAAERR
ncbi:MAG TPA: GAF domain-containing protein [Longimicrobiales bacterium]|nr:GAF domain-containing protein [Longimicrobiales bacterium]